MKKKEKIEQANEIHSVFKQAVMEQILRKRLEKKTVTLDQVLMGAV